MNFKGWCTHPADPGLGGTPLMVVHTTIDPEWGDLCACCSGVRVARQTRRTGPLGNLDGYGVDSVTAVSARHTLCFLQRLCLGA
jgi:hypothetical protein